MAQKVFKIGNKYTPRELMELAVAEMLKSKGEHKDKTDPKVGAVLSTPDGVLVEMAHRGEARKGEHAEFTLFDKKLLAKNVEGYTLYTTLEPCVDRNPPKKGCTYRTINARVGKVIVGHLDPDINVAGVGVELLEKEGIKVEYFDKDLEERIDKENDIYFREREKLAKVIGAIEISPVSRPLETELPDFELSDLSEEAQQEMIARMELPYKLGSNDYIKFLIQFGFAKTINEGVKPRPTGLGLLLLGKTPQYHFPQARIKFTVHRQNQEPIIKDFEGPILLMPAKVEDYLDIIITKEINRDKFHRTELTDVPKKALREVIINAIVHRDYAIEGAKIMVDVYPEFIEIISPGIPKFSIEKFQAFAVPSISKNPKIAFIFNQMSLVEERGLGMKELKTLKNKGFKSPEFRLDDNLFYTTVFRASNETAMKHILEDNSIKLTDSEQKGYNYLKEKGELTSSVYAEYFKVDQRTARRHLNKMVDKELAKREGEGPATIYKVLE
jgi:ATP-dependent DNA helicase RecG